MIPSSKLRGSCARFQRLAAHAPAYPLRGAAAHAPGWRKSSSLSPYKEKPVPLPALTALLPGGRCRPQRSWGGSSLTPQSWWPPLDS